MSLKLYVSRFSFVAGVMVALGFAPLLAFAADFDVVDIPKSPTVTVTIRAFQPNTLTPVASVLAKGTGVDIKWESDAGVGTPCITNFIKTPGAATPLPVAKSGVQNGTIVNSRVFTVVCAGKAASLKLTVGEGKLAVSGAGIGKAGLKAKYTTGGTRVANTYIGGGDITYVGTVGNSGNLLLKGLITTMQSRVNGGAWSSFLNKEPIDMPAGSSKTMTWPSTTGVEPANTYEFRFCAKVGANEELKCSGVPGKFIFEGP